MRGRTQQLERLGTGSADLDVTMHGGIPARSTAVVAGASGTGKTALILQMVFCAARQGKKCLFFTTLSEPAPKLLRYMQLYRFFDQAVFEQRIVMADLGTRLREQGPEAALVELLERVEAEQPELVVIDSFKALHELVESSQSRRFVYELAVAISGWGATTILIGEYGEQDLATLPVFAIADGILFLSAARKELTLVRELEIRKLRGSGFVSGVHFYDLGADGFTFYPRVRGPDRLDAPTPSLDERVSTGVPGLDGLFGGGLPRASSTVLLGGTGTGKTLLGLSFILDGARHGEPSTLIMLEEMPGQLRAIAHSMGWDLAALEQQGLLELRYTSPVELSTDRFLHDAVRAVERLGARRMVLDSLTTLALGTTSERRFKELVYALVKHMRALGVTVMMPMEITEVLGIGHVTGFGVSFAADNLVLLRHLERAGRLERAIAVIKARGVQHSSAICGLSIGRTGLCVGDVLSDLQGVLTGTTQPYRPPETAAQAIR